MTGNSDVAQSSNARDRRWLWGFTAFVLTLTSLPYLIAFFHQGPDWQFTGFLMGVVDGNSYIAKMLSGTWNSWLFRTPYTAYPQNGLFLFFPYILLGKLATQPFADDQLVLIYHLYRVIAGFLVIHATYDFAAVYLHELRWRRLVTVLAVLGGGFGWISILGLSKIFAWGLPLESYSPEAFGFLSIYTLPHLSVARALLLVGLRRFLTMPGWFQTPRGWLQTALPWAAIGLFQPIIQATGLFVIAFFLLVTAIVQLCRTWAREQTEWSIWWEYVRSSIFIGIGAAPIAAYTFLSFRLDPLLKVWESQSIIGSPPPHEYLIGYGVMLPLALLGLRPLIKNFPWKGWLLVGWLIFVPIAAYGPFPSQRRFLDGFWVALSILGVFWVSTITVRRQKLAYGWLSLAFPTTLFLRTAGFMFATNPSKPLYRPDDEVKLFEFLAASVKPWDVVLAAEDTANALPAWAPVRTLNGHGPESINGVAVRERISCFYTSACSSAERRGLIEEFGIDYVIWGPEEKALGDWDLKQMVEQKEVFSSGDYILYQIE